MVTAAARAVDPPDLAVRMPVDKSVEHREDWSCPDPRADQEQWRVRRVENEGPARRGNVERVPGAQAGVQVAARRAVMLALDTDPVVAGVRRSAEGVVAED